MEPPLPPRETVGPAQHFGDGPAHIHPTRKAVMVAPVGAGEVVVGVQGRRRTHCVGFVADGCVHSAADLALLCGLQQELLHLADEEGHAVHLG